MTNAPRHHRTTRNPPEGVTAPKKRAVDRPMRAVNPIVLFIIMVKIYFTSLVHLEPVSANEKEHQSEVVGIG